MRTLLAVALGIAAGSQLRSLDVVERRVEIEADWSRLPVIVVTDQEITYNGRLIATVDSVSQDNSPTFYVDALREQLAQQFPVRGHVHSWWSRPRVLCPEQTVIVELDAYVEPRVVTKIVATTSVLGLHAAVIYRREVRGAMVQLSAREITFDREVIARIETVAGGDARVSDTATLDSRLDDLTRSSPSRAPTVNVELLGNVDSHVVLLVIDRAARRGLHAVVTRAW